MLIVMSIAPAADVKETASPPAVEEKRQPVVSSSISSHVPAARINPPVNNTAPARPPPDRTEDEDNDYDSDDASKTFYVRIFAGLDPKMLTSRKQGFVSLLNKSGYNKKCP